MRSIVIAASAICAGALVGCGSGSGAPCTGISCGPACVANQPCTPPASEIANACKTYATVCSGGQTSCAAAGNANQGAACGAGQVCNAGNCVAACIANVDCTPAGGAACTVYRTACNALGTETTCATSHAKDDTPCGSGNVCQTGSCVAAIRTVSSTVRTIHVSEDGTETAVAGWPSWETNNARVTAILVPDSSASGYAIHPITVGADSSFSVPDVPAGPYFIQIDVDAAVSQGTGVATETILVTQRMLYEAREDDPDLSIVSSRRPDAAETTQPTPVAIQLTGLDPWG